MAKVSFLLADLKIHLNSKKMEDANLIHIPQPENNFDMTGVFQSVFNQLHTKNINFNPSEVVLIVQELLLTGVEFNNLLEDDDYFIDLVVEGLDA